MQKSLLRKKEINIDFIKDLFQRDNLDILYEITDYMDGKIKGILDENKTTTRSNAMETLERSKFSLKKFRVGKTNIIKNIIPFSSSYWEGKVVWYEEI